MAIPKDYKTASEECLDGPWKNRLALENSPYLLQHAHNPVDWYPWGEEAFAAARKRDVPVFLSVGYAACHWCHVMEHESFDDPRIAALMNEKFVNIKVDREERPDVDALYMDAIHAMGRHGGWPASIWMTAEGLPFFAGTYFPPTWRQGSPAFRSVLEQLAGAWRTNRERLIQGGSAVQDALLKSIPADDGDWPSPHCIERGFEGLQEHWDDTSGGWGNGAKFPMPPSLELLLRFGVVHRKPQAMVMLRKALEAMDAGGLHDHLGGGFHRYTVDPDWKVPHFEKMLYDNAQLLRVYAEAAAALDEPRFEQVAARIVRYLERDLRLDNGAYASSEDADSDGEEGTFYVWTHRQIHERLVPAHASLFCRAFSVDLSGNFEHGTSVLNRSASVRPDDPTLLSICDRVLAIRNGRNRPARDDKAVVAWNALAVGALARAGRLLKRPDWVRIAVDLGQLLVDLKRKDGLLPRTFASDSPLGVLEDHAFLAEALLDLFESTGNPHWLQDCVTLLEGALPHFEDVKGGGFFRSASESLLLRQKSFEDGAEPSGFSRMLQSLIRLRAYGHPLGEHAGLKSGLRSGTELLRNRPGSVPELLTAFDRFSTASTEVVVAAASRSAAKEFLRHFNMRYRPDAVLGLVLPETQDSLVDFDLFAGRDCPTEGARTFVCMNRACKLPIFDPERLEETLEA
jgi:uncharacterized protein YyaL (SSP411 family)